jgi:hypothetical protein
VARFYSNENLPLPVVVELRRLGHDVLTTHEDGRPNRSLSDEEVLRRASSDQRVLLTLNRKHFIKLHNAGYGHCGIIACTYDPDFSALARRIHAEIEKHESLVGILVRINRAGNRE